MERKVNNAEKELEMYSTFPIYPVCEYSCWLAGWSFRSYKAFFLCPAFLVACNVVLEISGNTSTIETYMNSTTAGGKVGLSYGPFGISASGSRSTNDTRSSCVTTASGCR